MLLSLDGSYAAIKVTARTAITKRGFEALFFLSISTHLSLSWTPTLSHTSGFAVYTDVWNKGPSNAQRFVFCLSSPHHSSMTFPDTALTVFILPSSTPPISCCTKSCETKTHQSHQYTTFILSISLFKHSKSSRGWIPSNYCGFLVTHCQLFWQLPLSPFSPFSVFFWAKHV